MKYGRDSISTESVINALQCKELELKIEWKNFEGGQSLYSNGKNFSKKNRLDLNKRNQLDKPSLKYFICHKGHFKKNYPERGKS